MLIFYGQKEKRSITASKLLNVQSLNNLHPEVDYYGFGCKEEKQLSQEELAEILDVSRQAVSKWEQGIGYPEVEKLLSFAIELKLLDITRSFFLLS